MFISDLFRGGKPKPDTDARTRILLSFAMDGHGANFAYWLRDRLMKKYGFFAPNAVYMDCIASRGRSSVHSATFVPDDQRQAGTTYVFPDERDKFKSQGYKPIGATNSEWNDMYGQAMREASAMVMSVTPEYMSSQWCMLEWSQFHQENQRRREAGGCAPLKGVALAFPSGGAGGGALPADCRNIQVLAVTKVYGLGGMLWHKEDFGIGEDAFGRLVNALGPRL